MFCTQCGTANPDAARFCRTCGANFVQPRQTTRTPATPTTQPHWPSQHPTQAQPLDPPQQQPPYPGYQGFPVNQPGNASAMKGGASPRAIIAMVVSIVSLLGCCSPLGLVGLILGKIELTAIEEGRASQAGKTFAKIAFYLGAFTTAIYTLGYIFKFLS